MLLTALFASCQSAADDALTDGDSDGLRTLSFKVSNYRQYSFDDLSSSDASTRAMSADGLKSLAHLVMAVFDAESGALSVQPIQHDYADYESAPETYAQFSVTLPCGKYRLVFLGYGGSRSCNIESASRISWADGYVPHTFLYSEELTVDKDTELDRTVKLGRAVSAFRLIPEDAIPATLCKMRFQSTGGGAILDATTGFTPQSTGYSYEIVVPSSYIGSMIDGFTVYLFLPEQEVKTDFTVQALGEGDAVLYERKFADAPLRINTLTTWKGKMFSDAGPDDEPQTLGFGIEWDTEWTEVISLND